MTYWEFTGRELVNCTCEYGCNCQFNALPDKGHCYAVAAIHIDEGRHGDTRLDGLNIVGVFKWPDAIHLGNGEAMPIVDERASPEQREALVKIMSGQDTDPFATVFAVFATTIIKFHEPVFAPIAFEVDVDGRRGSLKVPGYVEMTGEPIRNPVTGAESRAQILLPDGFEYEVANIGSASSRTTGGPMDLKIDSKYAQFANLHLSTHGVVRAAA
jgi:hypothetical protein